MIIPSHSQTKMIEKLISDHFGGIETKKVINHDRACLTFVDHEERQKIKKVKNCVDVTFYKTGIVEKVVCKTNLTKSDYVFYHTGTLCFEDHRTRLDEKSKFLPGRVGDFLAKRNFSENGRMNYEEFRDPKNGNYHNPKGYAIISMDPYKVNHPYETKFYLDGIHVGDNINLENIEDVESFLKNFILIK